MNADPFPYQDILVGLLFLGMAATTLLGALIAARSHRIIHSVCGLVLNSLGLAGLYYFLNSPFLALMEILIYVGAVCVTMVFAIMLSEPDETEKPSSAEGPAQGISRRLASLGVAALCLLLASGAACLAILHPWPETLDRIGAEPLEKIGIALLTTYALSFELISVVLLLAIIGALVIARTGRSHTS